MRCFVVATLVCLTLAALMSSGCSISGSVVYGSITGTVRDAVTGSPINTAIVTVRSGNAIVSSTTTNANGVYRVEDLQPGTYNLTAERTGYTSQVISVSITRATEASNRDFTLQPQS